MENGAWVDEALEIQKKDTTFHGKHVEEYSNSPLHGNGGPIENNTAPYYPSWQSYPSVPVYPPFNWDASMYPTLVQAFDTLQLDHQVVIGNVANLLNPDDPYSEERVAGNNNWIKDYVGTEVDYTEPMSDMYYPIFDNAADEVSIEASEHKLNMVGVMAMTFFWRDFIENILPPGSDGTVVVFENTCGQTFTYQINGPDVVYKGAGDLHDPVYDYMEQKSGLNNLKAYATGNRMYTGLSLSENLCPYTVRVYPSEDMENRFITSDPLVFTILAVSIFVFTSLVFLVYDTVVER
jgi:hypothetical protein